jgi:hypothetical protein
VCQGNRHTLSHGRLQKRGSQDSHWLNFDSFKQNGLRCHRSPFIYSNESHIKAIYKEAIYRRE